MPHILGVQCQQSVSLSELTTACIFASKISWTEISVWLSGAVHHQTQDVSQDWREEGESFWIPEASLHKIFRRHALFKKKKVGLYSKKDVMVLFIYFFWKKKAFALYHLMIESLMPSGSQRDGLFEAIVLILLQERRLCFSSCYFDQNKWCLLSLKFKCNIIFDDNKEYYPLCIHSCC